MTQVKAVRSQIKQRCVRHQGYSRPITFNDQPILLECISPTELYAHRAGASPLPPPKTSVLVRRGRQPTPTKTLHMPSHFSSVRAGDTHINTYLSSLHRVYDSHPIQQYRMNLTFMVGRQGGPTRQSPGGHLYGRSLNSYPLQDLGFPLESTEVISPVSSLGNPPQWQLVRRSKITE